MQAGDAGASLECAGGLVDAEQRDAGGGAPGGELCGVGGEAVEGVWWSGVGRGAGGGVEREDDAEVLRQAREVPHVARDELGRAVVVVGEGEEARAHGVARLA